MIKIMIALAALAVARTTIAAPAAETFFKDFAYPDMEISPSGRYIAALVPLQGTINVMIIDSVDKKSWVASQYEDPARVLRVRWKSDDRLIYLITAADNQIPFRASFAITRDGKDRRLLTRYINTGSAIRMPSIVDWMPESPNYVLIPADLEGSGYGQLVEVALDTDRREIRAGMAGGRNCEYVVDHVGEVRGCYTFEENLQRHLNYRDKKGDKWRTLQVFKPGESRIFPLAFLPDNKLLYVLSDVKRDTSALFEFDPTTQQLGEPVAEVPGADFEYGVYSPDGRTLEGLTYGKDRQRVFYLDDNLAAIQKAAEQSFPKTFPLIVNHSLDGSRAIILVASDQTPGKFYLYDAAKHSMEFLADRAPWIDAAKMGMQRAVQITARDGLVLRGIITLPPGTSEKGLPLVVVPSGGLDGRAQDGWNSRAQFLATQGYAVLRVNLRGSRGLGRAFFLAGVQHTAAELDNDIVDSVQWAVASGLADKSRLAVYGEDFGGYLALMTLVNAPDLFRCGISYGGNLDLKHVFQRLSIATTTYRERSNAEIAFWQWYFGRDRSSAWYEQNSPLYNADKIHVPVFLAYSREDTLVPFSDATSMRDKLSTANKKSVLFSKKNETHSFERADNQTELFVSIAAFLQDCNPAN